MKTITLEQLKKAGVCYEAEKQFAELFGESVKVTEEIAESVAKSFDWDWAARNLLTDTAQAEYNRARAPAWDECNRVKATAWDEYERVIATARDKLDRVMDTTWDKYERVRAVTFARLYPNT